MTTPTQVREAHDAGTRRGFLLLGGPHGHGLRPAVPRAPAAARLVRAAHLRRLRALRGHPARFGPTVLFAALPTLGRDAVSPAAAAALFTALAVTALTVTTPVHQKG
ncbi:hypothetical protein ACN9M0_11200 [Streptomyces sp. R-07]|uniref:hypothetical protein n=1 Tax=unclassified Streptomyces TaxID=2593676 RepID=UPI0037D77040